MRRARPWSSKDDVLLRELAAAGKYVVDIAAEMNRSESVIRTRAKENDLQIAKKYQRKASRERVEGEEQTLMATSSERPERSFANERQLIELTKTLSLETIVKRTVRKPETVLRLAKRLSLSINGKAKTSSKRKRSSSALRGGAGEGAQQIGLRLPPPGLAAVDAWTNGQLPHERRLPILIGAFHITNP
jgi:hypothetical protein